jgi:hypothetical protein
VDRHGDGPGEVPEAAGRGRPALCCTPALRAAGGPPGASLHLEGDLPAVDWQQAQQAQQRDSPAHCCAVCGGPCRPHPERQHCQGPWCATAAMSCTQMRDNPLWSFQLRNTKSTTPAQAVGGVHVDAHRVDQHSVLKAVAPSPHQSAKILGERYERKESSRVLACWSCSQCHSNHAPATWRLPAHLRPADLF